ncbi:egl nine homolog 1 [Patella vulgata]|uniref:egl nine homolog 1 n=1 Tax=Patella vulgata TaxID=6465 RepID=UPI0021806DB6|nr:egl nine homolog 1 [Patella vulgata]
MADKCLPNSIGVRDDRNVCQLCGKLENLSLCSGCRDTWYCCREHQKADWKKHKGACKEKTLKVKESNHDNDGNQLVNSNARDGKQFAPNRLKEDICECCAVEKITMKEENVSSVKQKNGNKCINCKQTASQSSKVNESRPRSTMSQSQKSHTKPESSQINSAWLNNDGVRQESKNEPHQPKAEIDNSETYVTVLKSRTDVLSKYVIDCLNKYGICVIDNFIGDSKGTEVLEEVIKLRSSGVFTEGQLVNSTTNSTQEIRGDVLTWVDGREAGCSNIHFLISSMDDVILRCAGKLQQYNINERTKAMVACYPGKETGYVRHVDNPNNDGRCVTCIYYLNKDWDVTKHGGMLTIYPEGQDQVANIEPIFDRLLFFWADRRNPHEVRPAQRERYAITVWYYDKEERAEALKQTKGQNPRKVAIPLIKNATGNGK